MDRELHYCLSVARNWLERNGMTDRLSVFLNEKDPIRALELFVEWWNEYVYGNYDAVTIQDGQVFIVTNFEQSGFLLSGGGPGYVSFEYPNSLTLVEEVSKFLSRFDGEFPIIKFNFNDDDDDDDKVLIVPFKDCHFIGKFSII